MCGRPPLVLVSRIADSVFQGVIGLLQEGPIQVHVLQHLVIGQLLGHDLDLP